LDPRAEAWLCWQVRRAVFAWGTWFEAQREATVEKPAPRAHRATVRVPKFGEDQLRAMLGLDRDGLPGPNGAAPEDDLDRIAAAFLAGAGPEPWPDGFAGWPEEEPEDG
jgi:hypothetical protein